jgi:hypothetical protein
LAEPIAVDDRIAHADAVAGADVDRHVGEPDGRRAARHPAGHLRVAGGDRPAFVEFDQLAQLRVFGQRRLRPDRLRSRFLELLVQARVFALRVEGLVEPVDEVAGRLQRPVGDRLNRAEDGAYAPLDAVRALPVGEREQGKGADYQQREHRPTAAYLLSIHVGDLSSMLCMSGG